MSLAIGEQGRPRGRADGEPGYLDAVEAPRRLTRRPAHRLPPLLGVLLVAHLLGTDADQRGAGGARHSPVFLHEDHPDALRPEVYPESEGCARVASAHSSSQEITTLPVLPTSKAS